MAHWPYAVQCYLYSYTILYYLDDSSRAKEANFLQQLYWTLYYHFLYTFLNTFLYHPRNINNIWNYLHLFRFPVRLFQTYEDCIHLFFHPHQLFVGQMGMQHEFKRTYSLPSPLDPVSCIQAHGSLGLSNLREFCKLPTLPVSVFCIRTMSRHSVTSIFRCFQGSIVFTSSCRYNL